MSDPQPRTPRDRRYRCAIIGTGAIAHAHAEALSALGDRAELVAVVDVDGDRARAFAERFAPRAEIFVDAAALLSEARGRAALLDLVQVCTPPQTHVPLAIAAVEAGVPVLVEKPTALSLAEMDRLVEASRRADVPAMTVYQHRFGPAARRLRRFAADGLLGHPLIATCETLWHRTPDYFDVPWRGRWEIEGGGPTIGHGIHQFDLLLSVLGPWTKLTAFAARRALPTDTEDVSMAVAEFHNGALATVVNSIVSTRETSRLRFDFERASVEVEHLYGYRDEDWTLTPAPGHEDLAARWADAAREEAHDGARSSHRDQLEAIFDAFDVGVDAVPGVDEARRTLEFAAAIYASAFGGRPVLAGEIAGEHPFAATMDGGGAPWPARRPALDAYPAPIPAPETEEARA